jgi:hypothetical protein
MTNLTGCRDEQHFPLVFSQLDLYPYLKTTFMKKTIFTTLTFLMALTCSYAQENTSNKTRSMGGGGFTIGYGNMDVSKLQIFAPAGTPKFGNDMMVIGGTGHGIMNNFVIGGSGFGIVGDVMKSDSVRVSMGGGLGTFDFGYVIINKEKLKLFPMLGIGGGGFGVQMTRTKSLSAAQVSSNPAQEINVNQGGMVADISINLNVIPHLNYDEKSKSYGGFMTGLKVGFVYGLPRSDWRYSGGDITGGPRFGINMWYVKLVIGGFGMDSK